MAAEKNNNTRRKVVANSNKLCRGTVVVVANFASDGALQSIIDLGSFPTTNKKTYSKKDKDHANKNTLMSWSMHKFGNSALTLIQCSHNF